MWIPGFAFCKGCCPENPCPTCLAGGSTKSCLLVTIAGVTGSSSSDGCDYGADKFNGDWLLCFNGDVTGDFSAPPCRWGAFYRLCAEGCDNGFVEGTLQITSSGGTVTVLAQFEVFLGGLLERLAFKHTLTETPNCYFKDWELPYSDADSITAGCDFSAATCSVSFEQSQRCYFDWSGAANDCDFRVCDRQKVPWHGVRVELEGFENDGCDSCHLLNGTYILSGPPGKDAIQISGASQPEMMRGWSQRLLSAAGCDDTFGGESGRVYDEILVPVSYAGGLPPVEGFAALIHNSAGFSSFDFTPLAFSTNTCNCSEADGEELNAQPGATWPGCTIGTARITPITP